MSVIYHVQCEKCQRILVFSVILDKSDDLLVDVEPCPDCIAEALEDAREVEA